MPFLQGAKTVQVFTVTDKETPAERESGEALVKHLAAHGIKARFEAIPQWWSVNWKGLRSTRQK
jgi:hypothetical protein